MLINQLANNLLKGIQANNCRPRHRLKRAIRRTFFSKKYGNPFRAFDLVLFYINCGYI